MSRKWTMRQALWCLIGSTVLTFSLSLTGFFYWKKIRHQRLLDPRYRITSIIQTGPEKDALRTSYLAELLDLSVDRPISLYGLNLKKAKEKLLASPLIATAQIKAIYPSTVYIDYEVRRPVAWLCDYQNVAVDREGYLFPVVPFLSPKELPEIYLGLPPFGKPEDAFGREGASWKKPLENPYFKLALEILEHLQTGPWREGFHVKRIDVSNAFAKSLGSREIVLFTEEELLVTKEGREVSCIFPKILRLAPKEYPQQLTHFMALKKGMMEEYRKQLVTSPDAGRFALRIVDLRIPQLAFVENR